jgi:hypothetical protein
VTRPSLLERQRRYDSGPIVITFATRKKTIRDSSGLNDRSRDPG